MTSTLRSGALDEKLTAVYGADAAASQRERYINAVTKFQKLYGDRENVMLFSVPGRSEICGNHTDHNHGRVVAAAIDLDIIAVAAPVAESYIELKSEGFDADRVEIDILDAKKCEKYSSSALISGVCAGFKNRSLKYGGFVAFTTNRVTKGSGLSSSAAFEVMIGNILSHFYNGGTVDAPELAKIAQYAENEYFGKPCGLMDQTACAVGGFVAIDFADPKKPLIEKLGYDLTAHGYALCVTNTGGNHADLNEDYASVPSEMKAVAAQLGAEVLRGITAEQIIAAVPSLRGTVGDRAILRALHFVAENDRVSALTEALRAGDTDKFLAGIISSGDSSFKWLQNVYTTKNVSEQGLSLALAVTGHLLDGKAAAWRVHGGGFAGTIQAFVPLDFVGDYCGGMNAVFGAGACSVLHVRLAGAVRVD